MPPVSGEMPNDYAAVNSDKGKNSVVERGIADLVRETDHTSDLYPAMLVQPSVVTTARHVSSTPVLRDVRVETYRSFTPNLPSLGAPGS